MIEAKVVGEGTFNSNRDIVEVTNDLFWETMIKEAKKEGSEKVTISFRGLHLESPWKNQKFNKLLSMENVYMEVYNLETFKNIQLALIIGGLNKDRIKHLGYVAEVKNKAIIKTEKYKARMVEQLVKTAEEEGEFIVIKPGLVFNQLNNRSAALCIGEAIEQLNNEFDSTDFLIDLLGVGVYDDAIVGIVMMLEKYKNFNIELELSSKETLDKLKIHRVMIKSNGWGASDRIKIAKEYLTVGRVGMLHTFKKTKELDSYGRRGNGEPITNRVAIFKGCKKVEGVLYFLFDQFHVDSFFTEPHYMIEKDNQDFPGLKIIKTRMTINQLGLGDKFFGELYYFSDPVQFDPRGSMLTYDIKEIENGKISPIKVTLPEYIKIVLDYHGIEHDERGLISVIEETKEILGIN